MMAHILGCLELSSQCSDSEWDMTDNYLSSFNQEKREIMEKYKQGSNMGKVMS